MNIISSIRNYFTKDNANKTTDADVKQPPSLQEMLDSYKKQDREFDETIKKLQERGEKVSTYRGLCMGFHVVTVGACFAGAVAGGLSGAAGLAFMGMLVGNLFAMALEGGYKSEKCTIERKLEIDIPKDREKVRNEIKDIETRITNLEKRKVEQKAEIEKMAENVSKNPDDQRNIHKDDETDFIVIDGLKINKKKETFNLLRF